MRTAKGKLVLVAAVEALLLGSTAQIVAASGGMVGDCVDCHTMHNSEQGQPVALYGSRSTSTAPSATPIANLLRMDCIACHAGDPSGDKIVNMGGGSAVPQVLHNDPTGDLAGGNFSYILSGGNRKGHNVTDLVPADTENQFPPGHRHAGETLVSEGGRGFEVQQFTCAGSMGCHGFRGQALQDNTVTCDEFGINVATGLDCTAEELAMSGILQIVYRTDLSALSGYDGGTGNPVALRTGAHHNNYDGLKNDGVLGATYYDSPLANSYRFIRGLRGYGNETERWQNNSPTSHNEYIGGYATTALGNVLKATDFSTTNSCVRCHLDGQNGPTSRLTVPGGTVTGFCVTCHGLMHSSGVTNGSSGAFLRHPSDYVIPARGEYLDYTTYNVTAPVARPQSKFVVGMTPSSSVNKDEDLVMCLSCHVAHAGPYDAMLRFNYELQTAGNATAAALGTGCMACHTSKGILPENR